MEKKIIFGTWQISDGFGLITKEEKLKIIETALISGISWYDTAAVYGAGNVEIFLGQVLPSSAKIITKVPAICKPNERINLLSGYYPKGTVFKSVETSCFRLKRNMIDVVLLHNWSENWDEKSLPVLELLELKRRGTIGKIGVSLPDGYRKEIPSSLCRVLDVIMAPYNHVDYWVKNHLINYSKLDVSVIVRSLFSQGLRLRDNKSRDSIIQSDVRYKKKKLIPFDQSNSLSDILQDNFLEKVSVVFGATNSDHIKQNINYLTKNSSHETV